MAGKPIGRDELRRRIWEVVDVLTLTLSEGEARAHAMKAFSVSLRTARRYVRAAEKIVSLQHARKPEIKRARLARRLVKLAESAEADRNHGAAVSALALYARIDGIDTAPASATRGALLAERTTTVVTDRGALVARQVERLSMLGDEQLEAVERALLRVTVDAATEDDDRPRGPDDASLPALALAPAPGPKAGS